MKTDNSLINGVLDHVWNNVGAGAFQPAKVFDSLPITLKRTIERMVSDTADLKWSACVTITGKLLAKAVKDAYRTPSGLGIVKHTARAYCLIRPRGLQRMEIADKVTLRATLQRLAIDLDDERERLDARRATVAEALAAIDRDVAIDTVGEVEIELLAGISRVHGDQWLTLRQVSSFIGKTKADRVKFLELADRGAGECQVQQRKHNGRHEFRIVAQDFAPHEIEPQIEPTAPIVLADPDDPTLAAIYAEHGSAWRSGSALSAHVGQTAAQKMAFDALARRGGSRRYQLEKGRDPLPPFWPQYRVLAR